METKQETPAKIIWIILLINIMIAGATAWFAYHDRNHATEFQDRMSKFADSIATAKLSELHLEALHLDSALKSSERKTIEKQIIYESIPTPINHTIISTLELDSFWTVYKP